jgi:hypothetical protein
MYIYFNMNTQPQPPIISPTPKSPLFILPAPTTQTLPPYCTSEKPDPKNYPTYLDYLEDYKHYNVDN